MRRLGQWLRRAVGHWLIVERNRRRWDRWRRKYD